MAWYEVRARALRQEKSRVPRMEPCLFWPEHCSTEKDGTVHNCPGITDVGYTLEILRSLGCSVTVEKDALILDAAGLDRNRVPESLGEKMRSSVILLGSLLGRFGGSLSSLSRRLHHRKTSHRPSFKNALRDGSDLAWRRERGLKASCRRLSGAEFSLPFPSVGATENVILAAVLAEGVTVLSGAAREPEISELCRFLRGKGARIEGDGTETIRIEGVSSLEDSEFIFSSDRIVAGTYLFGGVLTRGRVFLEGSGKPGRLQRS